LTGLAALLALLTLLAPLPLLLTLLAILRLLLTRLTRTAGLTLPSLRVSTQTEAVELVAQTG
jgi:hypothetical protein